MTPVMDGSQGPSGPTEPGACTLAVCGTEGVVAGGTLVLGEGTVGGRLTLAVGAAAIVEEDLRRAAPAHDSNCDCRASFGIGGSGLGIIGHRPLVRAVR